MNHPYIKTFLHRGLLFGGFGPIIVGIIYAILQASIPSFTLTGSEVCIAIVSTYVLAFLQAGSSVFNQIEEWPIAKSLFCRFSTLYLAYTLCYVVNTWIPFEPLMFLVFTGIFAAIYFVIWITVYLIIRQTSKNLNQKLG